jgi:hypothetical protein
VTLRPPISATTVSGFDCGAGTCDAALGSVAHAPNTPAPANATQPASAKSLNLI